jgi:hypothetical protein
LAGPLRENATPKSIRVRFGLQKTSLQGLDTLFTPPKGKMSNEEYKAFRRYGQIALIHSTGQKWVTTPILQEQRPGLKHVDSKVHPKDMTFGDLLTNLPVLRNLYQEQIGGAKEAEIATSQVRLEQMGNRLTELSKVENQEASDSEDSESLKPLSRLTLWNDIPQLVEEISVLERKVRLLKKEMELNQARVEILNYWLTSIGMLEEEKIIIPCIQHGFPAVNVVHRHFPDGTLSLGEWKTFLEDCISALATSNLTSWKRYFKVLPSTWFDQGKVKPLSPMEKGVLRKHAQGKQAYIDACNHRYLYRLVQATNYTMSIVESKGMNYKGFMIYGMPDANTTSPKDLEAWWFSVRDYLKQIGVTIIPQPGFKHRIINEPFSQESVTTESTLDSGAGSSVLFPPDDEKKDSVKSITSSKASSNDTSDLENDGSGMYDIDDDGMSFMDKNNNPDLFRKKKDVVFKDPITDSNKQNSEGTSLYETLALTADDIKKIRSSVKKKSGFNSRGKVPRYLIREYAQKGDQALTDYESGSLSASSYNSPKKKERKSTKKKEEKDFDPGRWAQQLMREWAKVKKKYKGVTLTRQPKSAEERAYLAAYRNLKRRRDGRNQHKHLVSLPKPTSRMVPQRSRKASSKSKSPPSKSSKSDQVDKLISSFAAGLKELLQ